MPPSRVAIVIHPGVQALDVAGPLDVFAEANAYLAPDDRYETVVIAADTAPLRASNGSLLAADLSFATATGRFAMVLVAGGPDLPTAAPDAGMSAFLRDAAALSDLHGSICTGAFALGHAGLLDGRAVTTHWQNAARLAARFPAAKVEFDRLYLRDGSLVTSAGVTAGIDLALALVAEAHGAEVSLKVAKRLVVVAQRQGGQSQFSPYLTAPADAAAPWAKVQAFVMAHIREPLPVEKLAVVAGMSARSFARLFVGETGVTPHEFVERARMDAARSFLEGSDLPLKAVAFECGFTNADRLRLVFQRRLGVSPAQYRASFRREA